MAKKRTATAAGDDDKTTPFAADADILRAGREVALAQRKIDEAVAEKRVLLKKWKADGVNQKVILEVLRNRKLDPEDVQKEMRDRVRYHALFKMPTKQDDLFDSSLASVEPSAQHLADHETWVADDAGYKRGRTGGSRSDNPYHAGTANHVAWDSGWLKGQASIAKEMEPGAKIAGGDGEDLPEEPLDEGEEQAASDNAPKAKATTSRRVSGSKRRSQGVPGAHVVSTH